MTFDPPGFHGASCWSCPVSRTGSSLIVAEINFQCEFARAARRCRQGARPSDQIKRCAIEGVGTRTLDNSNVDDSSLTVSGERDQNVSFASNGLALVRVASVFEKMLSQSNHIR